MGVAFSPETLTIGGEGPACDERTYSSHPRPFGATTRGNDANAQARCPSDGAPRPLGAGAPRVVVRVLRGVPRCGTTTDPRSVYSRSGRAKWTRSTVAHVQYARLPNGRSK